MDLILKSRLSFCSAILRVWIIAGDFLAARHLAAWWNSFGQRSCLVLCKAPGGTGTVPADSEEQTYTGAAHWNHWNQWGHLLHAQPWQLTWSFQEICSLSKFGACGELEGQPQEGKEEAVTVLSPGARQMLDTDLTLSPRTSCWSCLHGTLLRFSLISQLTM